ncbi:hypothetical protein B0H19DRAFT_1067955 [Mycena capillaripes]|nr:hypothetical protein B0H19DRAFT_1067955 [Mycena capillaripes]
MEEKVQHPSTGSWIISELSWDGRRTAILQGHNPVTRSCLVLAGPRMAHSHWKSKHASFHIRVLHGYRVHTRVWTRGSAGFGLWLEIDSRSQVSLGRKSLQRYYVKTGLSDVYALALIHHPSSKLKYLHANDFDAAWILAVETKLCGSRSPRK